MHDYFVVAAECRLLPHNYDYCRPLHVRIRVLLLRVSRQWTRDLCTEASGRRLRSIESSCTAASSENTPDRWTHGTRLARNERLWIDEYCGCKCFVGYYCSSAQCRPSRQSSVSTLERVGPLKRTLALLFQVLSSGVSQRLICVLCPLPDFHIMPAHVLVFNYGYV